MENHNEITITTRDRLLSAWQASKELVRDYQAYAHKTDDNEKAAKLFAEYAVDETLHASRLLDILHEYEDVQ